jgi:hypothetical protein
VPTVTIATQTIQLLGGAADTAPVPAASPSAAAGHATDNTSPPVSPLEPPATAPPPPTPKHAAIAAIKSRLAPHEQETAALLAQQELIKQQRKKLNRQAALIRERLEVVKPKLLPGQQELREEESYLQLVDQPKAETDAKLRAAQSRMALACGGHERLGLVALLQNIDISECVAKHVAAAVVQRRKLEEFGQPAANARKQLQFGMKVEGVPLGEQGYMYNGTYKVDHERLGIPVLKNEHDVFLFSKPCTRLWYFTPADVPDTSEDRSSEGTACRAHSLPLHCRLQAKAGYLPEGSQTWTIYNPDSKAWEKVQLTTTVFRTETQAADTQKADKAANEVELNEKAAAATAQLAGVEQIVVSGLPSQLEDEYVNLADGTYHRCDDIQDCRFPVFKTPLFAGRVSSWLLHNNKLQKWVITQTYEADGTPDPDGIPRVATMGSNSSDGTLAVGSNFWKCHGYQDEESVDQEWTWHRKMITVTLQQSGDTSS